MPLPSSDRDSPLEWTHLVDVANTFETERNTHYGNDARALETFAYRWCMTRRTLKDDRT